MASKTSVHSAEQRYDKTFCEGLCLYQHNATTCTSLTHRNGHQQSELVSREQQLWQRQEALWQQQLAHWQHEREMFIQREQALLVHIQQLHSHLLAVTTQNAHSKQPGGSSSSEVVQDPITADKQLNAEMLAILHGTLAEVAAEEQLAAAAADQREVSLEAAINRAELQNEKERDLESAATVPLSSGVKSQVPQGPPPPLSLGSDDIYWVHQLQSGLMNQGYHCGEEEMEDFIFESGTESAVLAFQVIYHFLCIHFMMHSSPACSPTTCSAMARYEMSMSQCRLPGARHTHVMSQIDPTCRYAAVEAASFLLLHKDVNRRLPLPHLR